MASVNIYEAKTQFSKLVKRVRAGQEIIIADAGTPVAKLVPFVPPSAPRVLGGDRERLSPRTRALLQAADQALVLSVVVARLENLTLVSADPRLAGYDVDVLPA